MLKYSTLLLALVGALTIILSTLINQHTCGPLGGANNKVAANSSQQQQQQAQRGRKPTAGTTRSLSTTTTTTNIKGAADQLERTFREQVDNYPEHEIDRIMRQTPRELRDLFNVAGTELDTLSQQQTNLTERKAFHYASEQQEQHYATSGEEHEVCATTIRHIYPKQALRRNSLVYVVNKDDYRQVVRAEFCDDPNNECRYLQNSLPEGYVSACHQKYSWQRLLYLDELERRMTSDSFKYPSCCTCMIRPLASLFDLRSSTNNSTSSNNLATQDKVGLDATVKLNSSDVIVVDSSIGVQEQKLSPVSTRESKSEKHSSPELKITTRDRPQSST